MPGLVAQPPRRRNNWGPAAGGWGLAGVRRFASTAATCRRRTAFFPLAFPVIVRGVKFLHAADLHLDSPLRGLERYEGAPVERMRGATRRAFENAVDLCLDEGVDFVLLAGDLYDGNWKDYSTGLFFAAQMSRLRQADIAVVWIRGNHDAASQITRHLRLPENVVELSTRAPQTHVLEPLGVAVHGQGFPERAVVRDLAERYPRGLDGHFNIGLLHTCASGREGHENYAPCNLQTLTDKGYDYWALGHVHRREVLGREPWVVFPGNLQGRHARETGSKGATLVEVEGGRVSRAEHRALDVVRWEVLEIDAAEAVSADDVVDLVRERLAAAAAAAEGRALASRLLVTGATRAHEALQTESERWEAAIRVQANDVAEGVWVEKLALNTRPDEDVEELAARDDAIGQVLRSLRALRGDEDRLAQLLAKFGDLRRKIPANLREGDDAIRLEDPEAIRAALEDVEQILLPRLLSRGGA